MINKEKFKFMIQQF